MTEKEMLEDLLKEVNEYHEGLIPVCSYEDCRAVRVYSSWVKLPYLPKTYTYTHTICPECKQRCFK